MRLEKIERAEISARRQWIVRDDGGRVNLARHFGGRTSNSGATVWPEWIEEGAVEIKSLRCLTENDLSGDRVTCFSGGGYHRVRIYEAKTAAVLVELRVWRRWRKLQPTHLSEDGSIDWETPVMQFTQNPEFEDEPWVGNEDAAWIARAVSYHEARCTEDTRLTEHEVSRYATSLTIAFDEASGADRWTAIMPSWPWAATRLDRTGRPGPWLLYKQEWESQTSFDEFVFDFVEADDPSDEPMPKPVNEGEDI